MRHLTWICQRRLTQTWNENRRSWPRKVLGNDKIPALRKPICLADHHLLRLRPPTLWSCCYLQFQDCHSFNLLYSPGPFKTPFTWYFPQEDSDLDLHFIAFDGRHVPCACLISVLLHFTVVVCSLVCLLHKVRILKGQGTLSFISVSPLPIWTWHIVDI